jgi:hypothetical protein
VLFRSIGEFEEIGELIKGNKPTGE